MLPLNNLQAFSNGHSPTKAQKEGHYLHSPDTFDDNEDTLVLMQFQRTTGYFDLIDHMNKPKA